MRIISNIINITFSFWEKLGFHITDNHFYQPIPDTRTLDDGLWKNEQDLTGIEMNEEEQLKLLSIFSTLYINEYNKFPTDKTMVPHTYYLNNPNYGHIDAEILYCMIRHFKPKKIIEIGSGFSTFLSAQAIQKNKEENIEYDCELTAIEPFPNDVLINGFPNLSRLVQKKLEEVPLSEFKKLGNNDILFIDSTHVLKIGSDVYNEYLKIIPSLNLGVIIHVHDIFYPAEYPKKWVLKYHRFWNEQYLLQAFLSFNDSFKVIWASSYMHIKYPQELEKSFKSYKKDLDWPGSFWMKRIK